MKKKLKEIINTYSKFKNYYNFFFVIILLIISIISYKNFNSDNLFQNFFLIFLLFFIIYFWILLIIYSKGTSRNSILELIVKQKKSLVLGLEYIKVVTVRKWLITLKIEVSK